MAISNVFDTEAHNFQDIDLKKAALFRNTKPSPKTFRDITERILKKCLFPEFEALYPI